MSARRQRIRATANLSQIKRKARKEDADPEPLAKPKPLPISIPKQERTKEDVNEIAFKMPAASTVGQLDEVFHSDIEDNVIQIDLQKTPNGFPMSPSKAQARQRVRPTPVFGQRRNSFVGSPLATDYDGDYQSPGTPTRRERYLSGSSLGGGTQQQIQASPKYLGNVKSPGMGRIRTESSCSVFSDSGVGGKQRKGDGEKTQSQSQSQSHAQQRVNAKRDFETRFNKGVPDKSTFKMSDMIFYNPDSNPMDQKPLITTIKAEITGSINGSTNSDDAKPTASELLEAKTDATAAALPVPQLKLDANGEMIIDEKTLEIETTAEVEARKVLANSSLILMDETTGDNGFYKRHQRTPTWSADDTVRFYRSLQIIGTDFSLMCQMFPKRTRRDLKLKYKREERINGQLINKALLYPKAFNIQELKEQLEKEDQERAEADRQWQEIVSTQASNSKKRLKSQVSKSARALSDGDLVYENEHVVKKRLGKQSLAKRQAELNIKDSGKNLTTKRKRRALNPKQLGQQSEEHLQVQKPLDELDQSTSAAYTDIKSERAIKTEESNKEKGEQLQLELNSLLEEGQTDDDEKKALQESMLNPLLNTSTGDGSLNCVSDVDMTTDPDIDTDIDIDIDTISQADTIFTIDFIAEASPISAPNSADISEQDIEQILEELAEGSMVLVSSLDAEHEDRVVNEIYIYDKQTGELCEQPLQLPEHIVQSILNVMS